MISELSQIGQMSRLPLVTLEVTAKGAAWFGKWTFNTSTENVVRMGGPWNTEQEACDAMKQFPQWKPRPHLPNHFDYHGA